MQKTVSCVSLDGELENWQWHYWMWPVKPEAGQEQGYIT